MIKLRQISGVSENIGSIKEIDQGSASPRVRRNR